MISQGPDLLCVFAEAEEAAGDAGGVFGFLSGGLGGVDEGAGLGAHDFVDEVVGFLSGGSEGGGEDVFGRAFFFVDGYGGIDGAGFNGMIEQVLYDAVF